MPRYPPHRTWLQVYIGALDLDVHDYEVIGVERFVMRPGFGDPERLNNDITLLLLKRPSRKQPVGLPDFRGEAAWAARVPRCLGWCKHGLTLMTLTLMTLLLPGRWHSVGHGTVGWCE